MGDTIYKDRMHGLSLPVGTKASVSFLLQ
eukprot:IDg16042t1